MIVNCWGDGSDSEQATLFCNAGKVAVFKAGGLPTLMVLDESGSTCLILASHLELVPEGPLTLREGPARGLRQRVMSLLRVTGLLSCGNSDHLGRRVGRAADG